MPPPSPRFEPIPRDFGRELPKKYDQAAVGMLNQLARDYWEHTPPELRYHGWGGWGYTLLRTVYTPESDALFPVAIERLRRLVRYWCHYTRFPAIGAYCEEHRVDYDAPNEEVFRRFFLEVVEDREGLADLDSSAGGDETARFTALADYFRRWCQRVEADSGHPRDMDPRFASCLVVDAESLAALAEIPDELPPLRCPANREEKADTLSTGYPAWMWLLEARYMAMPAGERDDGYPYGALSQPYKGWLRVTPRALISTWVNHWQLNGDRGYCLGHDEEPEGSGVFVYDPEYGTYRRQREWEVRAI